MPRCVIIDGSGAVLDVTPQPDGISACAFVMMTPLEFSQAAQVPDTSLAAEFFGFGFSMVVASFLGGWAVGSIRKAIRP